MSYNSLNDTMKIYLHYISYDNILIPLTITEFNKLENYYQMCQKDKSLPEIYNKSTILSLEDYKIFISFKEELDKMSLLTTKKKLII